MTITYRTRFSSKRKTLGLTVDRDSSIIVSAPEGTDEEVIEEFIARKKQWLYQKLKERKIPKEKPQRPWLTGKSMPYRGKNYRVEIVNDSEVPLSFKGKFFLSREAVPEADSVFTAWYKQKAQETITKLTKEYASQLGVRYSSLVVGDLQQSWGSCSVKGTITINWKLIKAPTFVMKYVIVHELAHLLELNHSKEFWTIVSIQLPRYEEAKQWLKEHGGSLWG